MSRAPSTLLQVTSHFSLLRGASSADELFATAAAQGWKALAITDTNTVAGLVRAHLAAKATGLRHIPAARLDLTRDDGTPGASLLVYPRDLAGWGELTTLLTIGKRRAGKGQCRIGWEDVAAHAAGLEAVLVPARLTAADAEAFAAIFPRSGRIGLAFRRLPGEAARLARLDALARRLALPTIALADTLYHAPSRQMLADVLACIRMKCTIDTLGARRTHHADRHLLGPAEMARRFALYPEALAEAERLAERLAFSLADLRYQYPEERPDPSLTPQETLETLTWEGAAQRYPHGVPPAVRAQLAHELGLIRQMGYAPYFLTVHAIVRFARSRGILCQGRGSAANSAVCYVLGITAIDPVRSELLFERFISTERNEPPDIDVDFEHERREEVIQWIYDHYGRDRAALTAVVSRFRARGAVREVGKALGLPEDVTAALAGQVWGWSSEGVDARHAADLGLDPTDRRLALTLALARELIGTPRHLSQHPGGFVLTEAPLHRLVPIEPAAMADRQVIEWEKDDIEALGFMKVDVLGLGMLGCLRRAFALLRAHRGLDLDLASIPAEDPATYAMIRRADTLGVFQIESRAQMAMLPRLKPATFYDLVIEVAIVRPGPIQGDMVHPYLRRREGKEPVSFPSPALERVLGKTLGVPLFQEQAMKVAIVCAGFTASEADALRRSMATFKFTGGVSHFRDKLVAGMVARGYDAEFAEKTFRQIEGFGSYGFPESHAASFALIAYASSWMKCHHPEVFACALLNAQPMGFYAPAQIVRDAREHGVEVRPVCVRESQWDCTLEPGEGGRLALRLGLRMVKGLAQADAERILAARAGVSDIGLLHRRSGASRAAFERLAEADAFRAFGLSRRQALWAVRGLGEAPLPLFAAADAAQQGPEPAVALRPMREGAEVVEDYRATALTLRAHPLAFLRAELARSRHRPLADLAGVPDGRAFRGAGIILVRQKPGSAKGVMFITLEDETGQANVVIWPQLFEAGRRLILSASMLGVDGVVQREGEVTHLVARRLADLSPLLATVGERDWRVPAGRGDEARSGSGPDARSADAAPKLAFRSSGIGHPRAIRVALSSRQATTGPRRRAIPPTDPDARKAAAAARAADRRVAEGRVAEEGERIAARGDDRMGLGEHQRQEGDGPGFAGGDELAAKIDRDAGGVEGMADDRPVSGRRGLPPARQQRGPGAEGFDEAVRTERRIVHQRKRRTERELPDAVDLDLEGEARPAEQLAHARFRRLDERGKAGARDAAARRRRERRAGAGNHGVVEAEAGWDDDRLDRAEEQRRGRVIGQQHVEPGRRRDDADRAQRQRGQARPRCRPGPWRDGFPPAAARTRRRGQSSCRPGREPR